MCHVLCNTLGDGKTLSESLKQNKKQFHIIYRRRLENLTPLIQENFKNFPGHDSVTPTTVTQLSEATKSFIIGNIVRQSKLFVTTVDESVLSEKEYSKKVMSNEDLDQIGTMEDKIYLEDLTGRILLSFSAHPNLSSTMITGLTLGIIGYSDTSGEFVIETLIYPFDIASQISEKAELDFRQPRHEEETTMFISSLNLNHTDAKYEETLYNLKMLLFHTSEKYKKLNVIVSGPIINDSYMDDLSKTNYISQDKEVGEIATQLKIVFEDLDNLFLSVLQKTSTNIYLQPGIGDPTDNTYPVPPLCSFLLNKSVEYSKKDTTEGKLFALSNPDFINFKENKIVVNCGSNIKDYYRQCCTKDTNQICLEIIKSAVNIPTCPMYSDSKVCLDCEDFITTKETATLYVFGKAQKFEYLTIEKQVNQNTEIKIIRIEEFHKTNRVCLFGIESGNFYVLECSPN